MEKSSKAMESTVTPTEMSMRAIGKMINSRAVGCLNLQMAQSMTASFRVANPMVKAHTNTKRSNMMTSRNIVGLGPALSPTDMARQPTITETSMKASSTKVNDLVMALITLTKSTSMLDSGNKTRFGEKARSTETTKFSSRASSKKVSSTARASTSMTTGTTFRETTSKMRNEARGNIISAKVASSSLNLTPAQRRCPRSIWPMVQSMRENREMDLVKVQGRPPMLMEVSTMGSG